MKNILCLLGRHEYSLSQMETKAVDERNGHLIVRVYETCLRCGKMFEDIIAIPIPKWLLKEGEKE